MSTNLHQKWKWERSRATVGGSDVPKRMPRISGGRAGSDADGALTRRLSVNCTGMDAGLGISEGRSGGSQNGTHRLNCSDALWK